MAEDKGKPNREKLTTVRQSARHTLEIIDEGIDPAGKSPRAILEDGRDRMMQMARQYGEAAGKPRPFRVSQRLEKNDDGTVNLVTYFADAAATPMSEDIAPKLKPFAMKIGHKGSSRTVDKGGGIDGEKAAPAKGPRPPPKKKPVDAMPPAAANGVTLGTTNLPKG